MSNWTTQDKTIIEAANANNAVSTKRRRPYVFACFKTAPERTAFKAAVSVVPNTVVQDWADPTGNGWFVVRCSPA